MRTRISLLLFALALLPTFVGASDYVLGPGDELEISFWQDDRFDAVEQVRQDGTITIDIIGEIEAAGKTTLQLQDEIVRRMSRLNKSITQAVVRVTAYNYQYVFVTGQVNVPGKLTFESIPDLVSVIQEAGWITDLGDLTRVTIIRGGEASGLVETVDLATAIATAQVSSLPIVRRQDAINIPLTATGVTSPDLGRSGPVRNVIYVTGAVTTPGPVLFDENVDIYEAIALAGGPTEMADLKKVSVLTKDGYYAQSLAMDLEQFAKRGSPARYIIRPEDHIVVPFRRSGFLSSTLGATATLLGIAASALIIYEGTRSDDED
jgi:polysaccharide export outer membrane protein